MAANTGERTLISALIPPGAAHIDGICTLASLDEGPRRLALIAASFASILTDFSLRTAPRANIRTGTAERLPIGFDARTEEALLLRILRLTALTNAFAPAWSAAWGGKRNRSTDLWTGGIDYLGRPALADVGSSWSDRAPLRRASDRRQALVEIDALVALTLNVSADELCTIYRTQFPVMAGYDRESFFYDANGRLVPTSVLSVWKRKGDAIGRDDCAATHPGSGAIYVYDPPFVRLDREQDLRVAYAEFEKRLANSA